MASKPPAFQFYAADYLSDEDVQLMSLEEEGCYIRLLAYCWREGSIPADPEKLSRLCKGASTTLVTVVAGCFYRDSEDGSRLLHKRLEEEREKQKSWSEKSSNGGRKSAEIRKQKTSGSTTLARVVQPASFNTSFASSSSSSELTTGVASTLSPEMLAKEVQIQTGIVTDRALRVLYDVCRRELEIGIPGPEIVKAMVCAWTEFAEAKAKQQLEFHSGAEKFFGENTWKNKPSWPWKAGQAPAPSRKYVNV